MLTIPPLFTPSAPPPTPMLQGGTKNFLHGFYISKDFASNYVSNGRFWLPLNSYYYVFFRQQFDTFPKQWPGGSSINGNINNGPVNIYLNLYKGFLVPCWNICTHYCHHCRSQGCCIESNQSCFSVLWFRVLEMIAKIVSRNKLVKEQ